MGKELDCARHVNGFVDGASLGFHLGEERINLALPLHYQSCNRQLVPFFSYYFGCVISLLSKERNPRKSDLNFVSGADQPSFSLGSRWSVEDQKG